MGAPMGAGGAGGGGGRWSGGVTGKWGARGWLWGRGGGGNLGSSQVTLRGDPWAQAWHGDMGGGQREMGALRDTPKVLWGGGAAPWGGPT